MLHRRWRSLRSQVRAWLRVLFLGVLALVVGVYCYVTTASHPDGFTQHTVAVLGVVGLTVGGAMLASALVAGLVSRQVLGVNLHDLIEALRGPSPLARRGQKLYLKLEQDHCDDQQIYVSATHEFDLETDSPYLRRLPVRIYTDVGRDGGFTSITVDGESLTGADLDEYLEETEGKQQFEKMYCFRPGRTCKFEINTFGRFGLNDRLIWTVEQVSRDFEVSIVDARPTHSQCEVKVNHHRRGEIDTRRWLESSEGRELKFDFLGEVLPFQGFELRWLDTQTPSAPVEQAQPSVAAEEPAATAMSRNSSLSGRRARTAKTG